MCSHRRVMAYPFYESISDTLCTYISLETPSKHSMTVSIHDPLHQRSYMTIESHCCAWCIILYIRDSANQRTDLYQGWKVLRAIYYCILFRYTCIIFSSEMRLFVPHFVYQRMADISSGFYQPPRLAFAYGRGCFSWRRTVRWSTVTGLISVRHLSTTAISSSGFYRIMFTRLPSRGLIFHRTFYRVRNLNLQLARARIHAHATSSGTHLLLGRIMLRYRYARIRLQKEIYMVSLTPNARPHDATRRTGIYTDTGSASPCCLLVPLIVQKHSGRWRHRSLMRWLPRMRRTRYSY